MSRAAAYLPAPSAPRRAAERGPRDRGPILFGLAAAALFFGGFGGWAALAPLSSAAVAPGQIKVDTHRKTVQHLEGGIVREIRVREGDLVAAGQLLVLLDETQAAASLDLLGGQRDSLQAEEARLVAERDGKPGIAFPPALAARRADPDVAAILAGQETIFANRRRALEGQTEILQQRIEQLKAEIAGYQAQVTALSTQSTLIRQEARGVEELVAKGLERRPRLLQLQREAANLEGNRGQQLQLIAKAHKGIGEAGMEMADLRNKQANEVAAQLRDTQGKLADLEEKLRAAADVKARTHIVAPEAGKVVNLRQFTPGGVVKPGEAILDIVPADDKLIVEAELRPLDIEGVHPGLPAEVRLLAYKQRRTPTLDGTVTYVSADALTNERTGQPYFVVRVEIPPAELARLDGEAPLYPGMPAEAMIVTAQRTALRYLLDPVADSFARAFREK